MASLNPQTLFNPTTPIYVPNPIPPSGLVFSPSTIGGPFATLVNNNGILESYSNGSTANVLNVAEWSKYYASTGHIDMAPGGLQRITATNSQLYFNGQALASGGNVADWSYYPVDSGYIDFASNGSERLTATPTSLVYNGVALTGGAIEDWSLYPSKSNVQMAQTNIENAANIYTTKITNNYTSTLTIQATRGGGSGNNINIAATNHLNLTSDIDINLASPQTNITAGYLSRPDIASIIDIKTDNGLYGRINLTANPGFSPIANNGRISLTANGGTDLTGSVGFGGNIDITANTPITVPSATSAIKVNAACVLSYAGFVPIIGSIAGVNFIYGSAGVSITSDVLGPLVGPVPGCVYLRGLYGTQIDTSTDLGGNRYGLYCSDYQPFADSEGKTHDLLIKGRGNYSLLYGAQIGNVNLENVATINGNTYKYTSGTNVFTSPSLQITGLSTINGLPYQPIGSVDLNLSGKSITNCANLQVSSINNIAPVPPLINLDYTDPFGYVLTNDKKNYLLYEDRTISPYSEKMIFQYTTVEDGFYIRLISDSLERTVIINGVICGTIQPNTPSYLLITGGIFSLYDGYPWYSVQAKGNVDMGGKNIANCARIDATTVGTTNLIATTASATSITATTLNGVSYPPNYALVSGSSVNVSDADKGRTYIIGGSSYSTFNFVGTVSPGWFCFVKNGSKVSGYVNITISFNGTPVSGTSTLFCAPNTNGSPPVQTGNSVTCVVLYNSLAYVMF